MATRRVARRTKLSPARVPPVVAAKPGSKVTEEDVVLALHHAQAYTRLALRWILGRGQVEGGEMALRSTGGNTVSTTDEDVIFIARLTKNCPPPVPSGKHKK